MHGFSLAKYGRSKEKCTDCKQVVLAVVVNTQGLLVRTQIYEGNRADCTTMKEVIKSIEYRGMPESEKKIIVMDAGISTKENLEYLRTHNYHYITVAKSSQTRYEDMGSEVKAPFSRICNSNGLSIRICNPSFTFHLFRITNAYTQNCLITN